MRELFPQLKYHRTKSCWIGNLKPRSKSSDYQVQIEYKIQYVPRVYVLSPQILPEAPHTYHSDKSLCLYYPEDGSWSAKMLIAKTIVPWTSEWLCFYEIWQTTGKWFGKEAPHRDVK
ncbi:MAG: hypothetical protein IT321_13810 [Anaerolineae bacterium]|nr:hypothetical protein [Anaerolineae bacterium]